MEDYMNYINFQVGEKFPLPIAASGDGGSFQIDRNGMMFLLQMSRTDIIAVEAFRTGKMEFALFKEGGILFFLYQIDGIFQAGWGDCPFAVGLLNPDQLPDPENFKDKTLHLYLIDTRLQVLLAMRRIELNDVFFQTLQEHTANQLKEDFKKADYIKRIQSIWQRFTSAQMREKAIAVQAVPLGLPIKSPSMKNFPHNK
jgi:hypothetical protein